VRVLPRAEAKARILRLMQERQKRQDRSRYIITKPEPMEVARVEEIRALPKPRI